MPKFSPPGPQCDDPPRPNVVASRRARDPVRVAVGVVQIVIAALAAAISTGLIPAQTEWLAILIGVGNALQGGRHVAPAGEKPRLNGNPSP